MVPPLSRSVRSASTVAKMFTARKKIVKEKGHEPTEFEEQVAQVNGVSGRAAAVFDVLETSTIIGWTHHARLNWRAH